jgi:Streptomyces sporulation and cell division protein, SsgA
MQTVVERELQVSLVLSPERSIPVPARLSYQVNDPYAVHVTFHVGSRTPVSWTFARELLMEGVFRPSGHGDVRVWPTKSRGRSVICLALSSPDGDALLEIAASPIASWLEHTLRAVPPGREHELIDIDGRLAELFAAAAPAPDDLWLGEPWSGKDEGPEPGA